jgi:hypothetical protein
VFFGFFVVFWPILTQERKFVQRLHNGSCMVAKVHDIANILSERFSCKLGEQRLCP